LAINEGSVRVASAGAEAGVEEVSVSSILGSAVSVCIVSPLIITPIQVRVTLAVIRTFQDIIRISIHYVLRLAYNLSLLFIDKWPACFYN
jgi:hypothetical protein